MTIMADETGQAGLAGRVQKPKSPSIQTPESRGTGQSSKPNIKQAI